MPPNKAMQLNETCSFAVAQTNMAPEPVPSPQAGLVAKPYTATYNVYCEWTENDRDNWNGPYLDTAKAYDPWGEAYLFMAGYRFCDPGNCSICTKDVYTDCPEYSQVRQECERKCGGPPGCLLTVVGSTGPDKDAYTCDDMGKALGFN